MATFGLTATGFSRPTLEQIRQSIADDLVNFFGVSIDLVNGILARFIGILAERYNSLWDALEAVNSSQNPDAAAGVALASICLITGTVKLEAIFSTVTLTLTGTPTTVVPAAQQVSTLSTSQKFLTAETGTIAALTASSAGTYATGARVTNAGRAYQALAGGASTVAPIVAPTLTQTDGAVTWLCLGLGTGAVDVAGQSVLKGPIVGVAHDIAHIDQPYGGWSGVINVLDAKLGYNDQTDESLRITREEELAAAGSSTTDAIRAAVIDAGASACSVFHNDTDAVDSNGMPPHSVQVLALGGADADIANAIFGQISAALPTVGTTTVNVTDSQGVTRAINFTRPQQINVSVSVAVLKDASYPVDGDAQIKAAIAAYGNSRKSGTDVRASAVSAQCFAVPGVFDVTSTLISSATAPATPPTPTVSTTIPISFFQLAVFDTSRITVTSTTGTP